MKLNRVDILNTRFTKTLRGYSVPEVDGFLQDMADQFGELAKEAKSCRAEAQELRDKLADYEARDATLRDTLISAHRMSEELKDSSQREAQLMVDAAQSKAEKVVETAQAKADSLVETARTRAETIVRDAQAKADKILEEAENSGEKLLTNARLRLTKMNEEISQAKHMRARLDMKLRGVINEHLKMLDMADAEQRELEEAAPPSLWESDAGEPL